MPLGSVRTVVQLVRRGGVELGRNGLPEAMPAVPTAAVLRLKLDVAPVNALVGNAVAELLMPWETDKLG